MYYQKDKLVKRQAECALLSGRIATRLSNVKFEARKPYTVGTGAIKVQMDAEDVHSAQLEANKSRVRHLNEDIKQLQEAVKALERLLVVESNPTVSMKEGRK